MTIAELEFLVDATPKYGQVERRLPDGRPAWFAIQRGDFRELRVDEIDGEFIDESGQRWVTGTVAGQPGVRIKQRRAS